MTIITISLQSRYLGKVKTNLLHKFDIAFIFWQKEIYPLSVNVKIIPNLLTFINIY